MFTPLNQFSNPQPASQRQPLEASLAALFRLQRPPDDGEYVSVRHFLDTDFPQAEEILCGLHRGEVAALVADDARAKTTLLLNLGLALAGRHAAPFTPAAEMTRGVLYLSGDAAPCRLQQQLNTMLHHTDNAEVVEQNLAPLLNYRVNGERLDLTNESHWQALRERFYERHADVIIVDGVKVITPPGKSQKAAKQQVMKQWQDLAEELHCVVIVTQTTGKANRLRQTAIANLSDQVDTIYQLSSDARHGSDYRLLSCEQSRWDVPEAMNLRLEEAEQWYHLIPPEEAAAAKDELPTIIEVVEFLGDGWQEIDAITRHFEGRANSQQVAKLIKEACLYGWIMRQGRTLPWQLAKRGKEAFAERKAAETEAAAKKNGSDTNLAAASERENGSDRNTLEGKNGADVESSMVHCTKEI